LERQRQYLDLSDLADPTLAFGGAGMLQGRMKRRMNLRSLHMGLG
jgi:hypothetical protein